MRPFHLVALGLICHAGCQEPPAAQAIFPVRGMVHFQGKPAGGVLVVFHADPATPEAPRAYGKTAADGVFALSTHEPQDGARPGGYRITLIWPPTEEEENSGSGDKLQGRFADPQQSTFRFEVRPGENIVPTLELN